MIRIFKLVLLLVVSQVAFGQAPSNYTNINGRYRWIAGMFDSTFHIPKGTSPSLRTGGSTNAGGLFYNTSDSSVYTYTGTQWIKARGSINPSDTTNKYVTQVYKKNGSDSVFYVKGGNHLFAFIDSVGSPGGGGGGKIYYFNGGVNMGTIGGLQMYELGDTANTGAAANFTRSTTGNIANFITDPGKPGLVQIPAGVWSVDAWLSETGGGANHAEIWIEVEKWDGSTITTIATSPIEQITEGSTPNLYSWSVSIPTTSLTVTDRIIIQFYISNTNGKTVTLYTQNGYVGEVHTTFTTGIGAINGLTAPAQYLVTGTSGTDFNINSVTATHTFNLPTASATNRGALSSTDWTTFNSKIGGSGTTNYVSKFTGSGTIGNSLVFDNGTSVGIGTTTPTGSGLEVFSDAVGGRLRLSRDAGTAKGSLQFGRNNGGSFQETSRISGAADNASVNNGSMTFQTSDGSGSLQINMTIESDGNVSVANKIGVGTLTQDSALTVEQGTHLQRGVRMSGLPSAVGTKSLRIDASGTLSVADTLTNGVSGSLISGYITKATGANTIDTSQIFQNNGRIGVSTTNPLTKLTVAETSSDGALSILGNSSNVGTFKFYANDGTTIQSVVNSSSSALQIGTFVNSEINLITNSQNRISILNNGNVGIGSGAATDSMLTVENGARFKRGVRMSGLPTAPGTRALRVDANGTLSVSDTLTNGISGSGTTNYIPKFTSSSAIGNSQIFDNGTNVGIGTTIPGNKLTVSNGSDVGYLDFNNQSFILGTSTGSGISLFSSSATGVMTFSTNSILRMTLDASGNLGLGVTPSAWGSAAKAFQIGSYGSISAFTNELDISSNSYWNAGYKYTNTNPATLYTQYNGQHQWFNAPSGTAGNAISFTQAMTLDASGRLGIGTTSPSYKITTSGGSSEGAIGIERTTVGTNTVIGALNFTNNNAGTVYGRVRGGRNAAGDGYVSLGTGVGDNLYAIEGGNVGIGTTSPQRPLHINGTEGVARFTSTASGNDGFEVGIGTSSQAFLWQSENAEMQFATNNTERMRITAGGEVYIGNNPADQGAYNLQVNGTGVWGAGAYVDGSDSAVKKNIQPLGSSLDLIKQMNPVTFEYQPFYSKDTTTQTGFIAQELQQVLSDKVYKNGIVKEGGQYLGVAYQHLIPLLVKSIQEQQTQIDQLKAQLNNR